MRLVDLVLRRGHLSDGAILHALMSAERHRHLDSCDLCAERALLTNRWLEDVRAMAQESTDAEFPPERLAAQEQQILRRLEQIDAPSRVLSFPAGPVSVPRARVTRRVAPAWLGVAAAAGLVVGVIGGQLSARRDAPSASTRTGVSSADPSPMPQPAIALDVASAPSSILELNLDSFTPDSLRGLDDMTPEIVDRQTTPAGRYN